MPPSVPSLDLCGSPWFSVSSVVLCFLCGSLFPLWISVSSVVLCGSLFPLWFSQAVANRTARKRYRSQVVELERQLAANKAMFKQYKESMRNDMLNEISLAKKAALLKIVDSGTVTKGNRLVLFSAVQCWVCWVC